MTLHDAYMIGTNWLRPGFAEEFQERSECRSCRELESMEHVLTQCEIPGQAEIWKLAKELWSMRGASIPWIDPTFGNILASPSVTYKAQQGGGKPDKGSTRFYRILMTESAHLIWRIRCERVIQSQETTPREVHNRWVDMMNKRLEMDCQMADAKYEKKALRKDFPLNTWKGALLNEDRLPADWAGENGVLVGIMLQKNDGCGRER